MRAMVRLILPISILPLFIVVFLTGCDDDDSSNGTNPATQIVINEILARNITINQDEQEEFDDWIELYNPTDEPVDIGGFSITDDIEAPDKWTIPTAFEDETTIPPNGYLIIWADGDPEQGPLHTNFNLSGEGENVALYDLDGNAIDVVLFGPQVEDIAYGRLPNGAEAWKFLSPPTPGAMNTTEATNQPPSISDVNHWPAIPLPGEDITISAYVIDEFGVSSVSLFYRIDDGEFSSIPMQAESGFDYEAVLPGQDAGTIISYYIGATDTDSEYITDPQFAPSSVYGFTVISLSGDRTLFINEFLADNESINTDNAGETDDWIEIYNAGSEPVDLGGMYITDDLSRTNFYQIPLGHPTITTIPAGGYLLLWADKDLDQGPLHVNIKLSADGESIGLYDIDAHGNQILDAVNFSEQTSDVSYGRSPDGSDTWESFESPSPGGANP